ncbi:CHASE3 domain-containing protein [Dapis sp. BLCC M229]|uniref:CHASE3 domain-containing protein n=1 Tax=Dapis sp. BLCC M229 TaxID=3400188 RepID=UPI003CF67061
MLISAFFVYLQVEKLTKQAQKLNLIETQVDNIENLGFSILSMQNNARGYLLGKFSEQLTEYEKWDTKFYAVSISAPFIHSAEECGKWGRGGSVPRRGDGLLDMYWSIFNLFSPVA